MCAQLQHMHSCCCKLKSRANVYKIVLGGCGSDCKGSQLYMSAAGFALLLTPVRLPVYFSLKYLHYTVWDTYAAKCQKSKWLFCMGCSALPCKGPNIQERAGPALASQTADLSRSVCLMLCCYTCPTEAASCI